MSVSVHSRSLDKDPVVLKPLNGLNRLNDLNRPFSWLMRGVERKKVGSLFHQPSEANFFRVQILEKFAAF
jgi:hypothetical protein